MMSKFRRSAIASFLTLVAVLGCGSDGGSDGYLSELASGGALSSGGTGGLATSAGGTTTTGGALGGATALGGSGGMSSGGVGTGGLASGGGASGGELVTGGAAGGSGGAAGASLASGGAGTGGAASGGAPAGGAPAGGGGGVTTGGAASGGAATGGAATGGAPTGGTGGEGIGGTTESGGTSGTGGTGGTDTTPVFHVFLLLGQSNMEGYPKAQAADRVEDERVLVLGYDDCAATGRQTDQWDVAAPPLHSCWNDGLGPGDYFSKTLVEVIPAGDSIGLVPCAINGEKIETFMKVGGTKYDWIVHRAQLAQQAGGVIEGILFHQGESNNGDTSWPGKVNTLVEDLRADLGLADIPFLAGELLYSGSCAGHNTLINQLPSVVTNAYVVSASGLVVDPSDTEWYLHFDHDSQVTFGTRYAQTMIEALGW
jgi:hypothetical protein